MKKILHSIGIVVSAGMFLYSAGSMLLFRYTNVGNWGVLFASGALLFYLLRYDHFSPRMRRAMNIVLVVGAFAAASLSGAMIWAAYGNQPDPQNPPETIIVLGAKINGDQPSKILKRRLLAAADYLRQYPETKAIVAGGLGDGEEYTEAHVMKQYLQEQGIDGARVFEEGASSNTYENLQNAATIIQAEGLGTEVAVGTDGFHQLRAAMYARKAGLHAYAVSSNTPIDLVPMYVVREWFALAKLLVVGK